MNQEQINEKLSASAPAKDWIEDFVKSDDPKFAGKSKDERIMMALGAYYAAQKNESVELEENAGYMETLHTKYKFLRRQADEAEEKYKKAKERNLDDDSLETYYTAVRTLNDRADDVYDAYVDARDKAKKNESVEQIQENMGTATVTKTGHRLNGKTGRIFHKFEDGRINVQLTNSTRKGDVTNLTLHPGQYRLNADQKNESVELEEAVDFRTMKDDSLKQWLRRNDTDDSVSAVVGAQILAAKKEAKRRGIQSKSEGSVSLNYDREGGIPVTEVKSADCGLDDLETAIADQEAKKKKEKAEGEGTCKTEALDPVGKEDDDVDNDGDSDESDEYLKNRRKAVTKAIQNEEVEELDEEPKIIDKRSDKEIEQDKKAHADKKKDKGDIQHGEDAIITAAKNDKVKEHLKLLGKGLDQGGARRLVWVHDDKSGDTNLMAYRVNSGRLDRDGAKFVMKAPEDVTKVSVQQIINAVLKVPAPAVKGNDSQVVVKVGSEAEAQKLIDKVKENSKKATSKDHKARAALYKRKDGFKVYITGETPAAVSQYKSMAESDESYDEVDAFIFENNLVADIYFESYEVEELEEAKVDEIKVGAHVTLRNGKVGRVTNVSSDKAIIDVKLNDGGKEVSVPIGKLSLFEELEEGVEAHGVKGSNSTKWRKTFKDRAALNAWVDANDAEVYAVSNDSNLDEGVEEIKARVAKYSVGDKTNFGVIKSISSTSIEFKSKDLPVTKIAFNQRKMGSKDFVLDRLSRMNESFTEARDLKIAQLALRSDGSGQLEDFVKNYSVVGKSILQIKEEYATFLKANKKQEEEGIQNYP